MAVRKTKPRMTAATAATRSLTSIRNHLDAPPLLAERVPDLPTIAVVGLTGTRSI
jgi:hypothetical protein